MRRLSHKLTATAAALMVSASGLVAGSVLRATVAPHLALASCNDMSCEHDPDRSRYVCSSSIDFNCTLDGAGPGGQACVSDVCDDDDDCEFWQIWCN